MKKRKSIWRNREEEPKVEACIVVKQRIKAAFGFSGMYVVEDYFRTYPQKIKEKYSWKEFVSEHYVEKWCYEIDLERV